MKIDEAPKPLQPLAGVHGYEGLNYDHIYNNFQLQESIAERSQKKSVYGYSGKVRAAPGGRVGRDCSPHMCPPQPPLPPSLSLPGRCGRR